jgi:predicted Zn-dependent protease
VGPACLLALSSCAGFNAFTPQQGMAMGLTAYEEILHDEQLIQSGQQHAMVLEVTNRLVAAARAESPDLVDLFEWHVELIDNAETLNAFCLPGGKMAVYTGILQVTESPTGLAVVMGHEIAHATQRHGTRAVTRANMIGFGLTIAEGLLSEQGTPAYAAAIAQGGAALVQLSYGRDAELEADEVGLRIMARAGYDPREAVAFWGRMAALSGAGGQIEFLSTHPSNANRIQQIESLLPSVLPLYEASGGTAPPPVPAEQAKKKAPGDSWR